MPWFGSGFDFHSHNNSCSSEGGLNYVFFSFDKLAPCTSFCQTLDGTYGSGLGKNTEAVAQVLAGLATNRDVRVSITPRDELFFGLSHTKDVKSGLLLHASAQNCRDLITNSPTPTWSAWEIRPVFKTVELRPCSSSGVILAKKLFIHT